MIAENRERWIADRISELTGQAFNGRPQVFSDTSNFMSIDRDNLIELDGELFLVRCSMKEGRFGLGEQPKFWVKRALSLSDGDSYILKLAFYEEFKVHIGPLEIKCKRSGDKEKRVLELVRGDRRFMQGRAATDSKGNLVRIIEFIHGEDLMSYLYSLDIPHEEYFTREFPGVLAKTMESIGGILLLHNEGLCHGDIRNDHILIERDTGRFRWIDFDLTQDFPDFDVWSLGNILHCIVGKSFVKFRDVLRTRRDLCGVLNEEDASLFFPHRIMNLRKIYPCIPQKLNDILMRFSVGAASNYECVGELLDDLGEFSASI